MYHYKAGVIVPFVRKHYQLLIFAFAAILGLSVAILTIRTNAAVNMNNVVVTPDNSQGWLFNGDPRTATDYQFTDSEFSLNNGSLEVLPISNDYDSSLGPCNTNLSTQEGCDKFIAILPSGDLTENVESLSYDFKINTAGGTNEYKQFYLNVYTLLKDSPDTFYDCRFDFVPTSGNDVSFTNFVVANSTVANNVGSRNGTACPTKWEDMPSGSTVNFIAINLGDTTVAADQDLGGYFDNVVVTAQGGMTVFDFEPELAEPVAEITAPEEGDVVRRNVTLSATYEDGNSEEVDEMNWAVREYSQSCNVGLNYFGGGPQVDPSGVENPVDYDWDGSMFDAEINTRLLDDGEYCFVFNPTDETYQPNTREIVNFVVDNTRPEVEINSPSDEEMVAGDVQVLGTVTDANPWRHRVIIRDDSNSVLQRLPWVVNMDGLNNEEAGVWDSTTVADGRYRIQLRAQDQARNARNDFVWVATDNYVDNKDECRDGGWERGMFDGTTFRNQGDCVSYFATENSAVGNNPATNGATDERANRNRKNR